VNAMARHRRPGVLGRVLRLRQPPKVAVPTPHRAGIELVDAQSGVTHRVSLDGLQAGRAHGDYKALCGVRLLAASLTDPGRSRCTKCEMQSS
jgi:hypothetical protein